MNYLVNSGFRFAIFANGNYEFVTFGDVKTDSGGNTKKEKRKL
jgi:hypothetical protein